MGALAESAQARDFKFATLKWFQVTPVSGLGPELRHARGLALPHPWDCVGVTVALGLWESPLSVIGSGLAYGRCMRAPFWPLSPSTDTRVV